MDRQRIVILDREDPEDRRCLRPERDISERQGRVEQRESEKFTASPISQPRSAKSHFGGSAGGVQQAVKQIEFRLDRSSAEWGRRREGRKGT